jgi:hypothetical protein
MIPGLPRPFVLRRVREVRALRLHEANELLQTIGNIRDNTRTHDVRTIAVLGPGQGKIIDGVTVYLEITTDMIEKKI